MDDLYIIKAVGEKDGTRYAQLWHSVSRAIVEDPAIGSAIKDMFEKIHGAVCDQVTSARSADPDGYLYDDVRVLWRNVVT